MTLIVLNPKFSNENINEQYIHLKGVASFLRKQVLDKCKNGNHTIGKKFLAKASYKIRICEIFGCEVCFNSLVKSILDKKIKIIDVTSVMWCLLQHEKQQEQHQKFEEYAQKLINVIKVKDRDMYLEFEKLREQDLAPNANKQRVQDFINNLPSEFSDPNDKASSHRSSGDSMRI